MDGKKRTSLITASEKALMMIESKSKSCPKDKVLEYCVIDARSCFNLSNDPFWKNVETYIYHHYKLMDEM